jgi:hypothetical protein
MAQVNPRPPASDTSSPTAILIVLGVLVVLVLILLFMTGALRLPSAPADLTPSPGAAPVLALMSVLLGG